ncbi:hypothetical protein [Streptomyces sp. NBC_01618]|uniref:hypothetical protein n=1 Tax=Streptomyces sp. NBC_01618 TaxID=2975900 RepID=UPI003868332D|nr:hypothetical protein OH735_20520 [Streptomyces sp. NBC_01618]
MASKESTPAGESTAGSSVRRAAALAALTEEPSTGLFPETATSTTAASTSTSTGTSVSGAATATAVASAPAEPAAEEGTKEGTDPAAEKEPHTTATTVPSGETAAATAETAEATTTGNAAAPAGTASETRTQTRTASESAAEARLATATRSGTSGGLTTVLPLGRPKKPVIAAAMLCGLVLIGLPFLISGPDDKPRPKAADAPVGSSMNPDGSGPGLVPGEQHISAPGVAKAKDEHSGKGPGPGTGPEHSTGPLGGIHESGTSGEDKGTKPGTPKDTPPSAESKQAPANDTPAKDKPANAPAAPAPAPAATYSHLIGPGCNTPGFATGDYYTDGNEGWRGSRGSTTSYGCSGFYYSLPMSGSSRSDGIWAQWKFTSGDVKKGNCSVQVYIPNVHDLSYVGGTPGHYTVYGAFTQTSSNQIGSFEINQPSHLGQWVAAGTFPITGNKISVVLDNRGNGADNRHAAAAPVRVNCTAT